MAPLKRTVPAMPRIKIFEFAREGHRMPSAPALPAVAPPTRPANAERIRVADVPGEPTGSTPPFDGPALRHARLQCGLSLERLAEVSKIRSSYLEAIEAEDFRFLPAQIYVRGFVTIVAELLRLPADRVASDYMARYRVKVAGGKQKSDEWAPAVFDSLFDRTTRA